VNFDIEGPFELTRHTAKKIITKQTREILYKTLERKDGLSNARGCYVFATRAGRGYMLHYVRQACKRALIAEALNSDNITKYNTCLSDTKGTPVIFLVLWLTPGGRLKITRTNKSRALDFLEEWLIATALYKNPNLINNKKTFFLRNIHVRGIFNPTHGGATNSSRLLKKTLW
jgi:hypothetical protein